jgi:hypothetical protein
VVGAVFPKSSTNSETTKAAPKSMVGDFPAGPGNVA